MQWLMGTQSGSRPDRAAHLIFWSLAALGLTADLWTKHAVFSWLQGQPNQSKSIIDGFLTFTAALNDGAAFGMAAGRQTFLVGVSCVALIAIVVVFLMGGARHRVAQVAMGLFAAGVCGNLWDRLFNEGRVRDFIDVVYWPGRHWHTFNVADALLCVAVGLLVIITLATDLPSRKPAPQQK
jgi:signal peptidase II